MPKTILIAFLSILTVGAIILQPDASFKASLQGLTVWWNIVFPGLLPFLVLLELMRAFGLAHAMGALLRPFMHRLFRLPGHAASAVVIGWMGGYPAGGEAAATLRRSRLIGRPEGQRLLAYAHMPNPLFMLVVVGAGFLGQPQAGFHIAASVWLSALWLMLAEAQLGRIGGNNLMDAARSGQRGGLRPGWLMSAAEALHEGRRQDGRSFGTVLGDAVTTSVQKLMAVGGFIMLAAVLAKLTEPLFEPLSRLGLTFFGPALFESHLGAYAASAWLSAPYGEAVKAGVIAAVLAFGGLSGVLLAGYSISGTDLRLLPFVARRIAHAAHAFLFALLLREPLNWLYAMLGAGSLPSFFGLGGDAPAGYAAAPVAANALPALWPSSLTAAGLLALSLTAAGLTLRLLSRRS